MSMLPLSMCILWSLWFIPLQSSQTICSPQLDTWGSRSWSWPPHRWHPWSSWSRCRSSWSAAACRSSTLRSPCPVSGLWSNPESMMDLGFDSNMVKRAQFNLFPPFLPLISAFWPTYGAARIICYIFFYHLMPRHRDSNSRQSVELHQTGTFEGCSTDSATALQFNIKLIGWTVVWSKVISGTRFIISRPRSIQIIFLATTSVKFYLPIVIKKKRRK